MDAVREKWTDERLDDLSKKVEDVGRRMDLRFDAVDRRFEAMDRRFDSMQRVMITAFVTGFLTLAGLIAGLAGLIVSQH
jgi:hypothetical protein